MMDKYFVFFVISLLLYPNADGRSWYQYDPREHTDDRIVFEVHRDARWRNTDNIFDELGHSYGHHESDYKHPRDWNPDRVWFPDSDDQDRIPNRSTSNLPRQVTTSSPLNINACIKQCPTTSEYNPVCGSNRITYSNIGHLECARLCGLDVSLQRNSPCSFIPETSTSPTTTTESDSQRRCIETCPTTPEYNPICGTNNVTYQNRGKLECAKICGVDVELKRLSPCPKPATASPNIDDIFSSTDRLPWASNTGGSAFTQTTRAPDTPKFTISQDVLNSIFNVPTPDSDDVDIDVRQRE